MKIKLLNESAQVPTRGSAGAAGYDLYSTDKVIIVPGTCVLINTGIAMEIPQGYFGAIYPRSGLAVKRGLRLANGTAVIDEDFRGPVKVALFNDSPNLQTIEIGDRIAQLVIQPYLAPELEVVDELDTTERGEGGFGSTGTK